MKQLIAQTILKLNNPNSVNYNKFILHLYFCHQEILVNNKINKSNIHQILNCSILKYLNPKKQFIFFLKIATKLDLSTQH